jgi:hypothetical protein
MKARTKSILGSVHTRILFAAATLMPFSFAATPGTSNPVAIGMVTASGHFLVDRSEVWGNATLFDGAHIDTTTASSQAALRNGVKIQLGSASSASVNENHLTLTKGVGQVAAPESYEVSAGELSIRSAAGNSRVRVAFIPGGNLEVTALSGAARVANRSGLVLASVPAGRQMTFAMQAAAAGVITRTGCLLSKEGRFLIQDQNTQEVVEVRGDNLAANVGNRVAATGTVSVLRPAIAIATSILNANAVVLQQTGGCLSVAAALDAQTEPTNAAAAAPSQPAAAPAQAPAQAPAATATKTGMSTGAKVAIVAVVAGGGAGAAIALSGKKGSTSP